MPLTTGSRLGHYEVISLIGSGGMGDVYRARDPRLAREVAVKTLRSADADARARLWREARAAASVSHPGICQIHDVGETSDNIYIVMELLQGESLAHRLKDGPLPVDEAIAITLSILSALTVLHGRDIVHRDLKPSNVFLTPSGCQAARLRPRPLAPDDGAGRHDHHAGRDDRRHASLHGAGAVGR